MLPVPWKIYCLCALNPLREWSVSKSRRPQYEFSPPSKNLNSQSYLLIKNKSYFEPDLEQWRVTAGVNIFLLLTLDGYASLEVLIAVLL